MMKDSNSQGYSNCGRKSPEKIFGRKMAQTAKTEVKKIEIKNNKGDKPPISITASQHVYNSHSVFYVFKGFYFKFYNFLVLCRKNLPFFPNLSAMANNEVLI